MPSLRAALACALCGAALPGGGGPPAEHAAPAHLRPPTDTTVGPLRSIPRYNPGRGSYEVVSISTVSHDVDGAVRTDTLTTQSRVDYDARWTNHGLDVTGSVVSHVVNSSQGIRTLPAVIPDPVPFTATVDTATSRVDFVSDSVPASARACPAPNTEA